MKNKFLKFGFLTAIVLSLFLSAFDTTAQTTKRRKKTKRVRKTAIVNPQPVQTPVVQNQPYIDGNQIVLGEIPTAPPEETNVTTSGESTLTPVLPDDKEAQIQQLGDRIKQLESVNGKEAKQKQLLNNLDILTRAEGRVESLRKQLFEAIEKESTTQNRLQQIQYESRSDVIDRNIALSGSLRPEELRDQRRKSLDAEKTNLETLLTQIQSNRTNLESSIQKADALVEKIRAKLDKEIDDALTDQQ